MASVRDEHHLILSQLVRAVTPLNESERRIGRAPRGRAWLGRGAAVRAYDESRNESTA
jgi:hypothetical protein